MNLKIAKPLYMVCRFEAEQKVPDWIPKGFGSITRTDEELSIVCEQTVVENVIAERDWRLMKIAGPLDFSEIGILAKLTNVLALENISIFVISTYDTDYILVKNDKLADTINALTKAGYKVTEE